MRAEFAKVSNFWDLRNAAVHVVMYVGDGGKSGDGDTQQTRLSDVYPPVLPLRGLATYAGVGARMSQTYYP